MTDFLLALDLAGVKLCADFLDALWRISLPAGGANQVRAVKLLVMYVHNAFAEIGKLWFG